MSYFLLIDLLRSIQDGHPTSFPTALFLYPKARLSNSTTPMVLLVNEYSENPLLAILSLLADAHLVTTVFDPLTIQPSFAHSSSSQPPAAWMTTVPFTPRQEIAHLRRKLLENLMEWNNNHSRSAPNDVVLLYHLCHLHTLVPSLQSLFRLSGYVQPTMSASRTQIEVERSSEALSEYCAAIAIAWQILETSEAMQREELPIWAPLSVFSAGLVFWARNEFATEDDVDSRPARSLDLFRAELARMKFSGAREMSTILANLGKKSPRGGQAL
jgi:hypothetical protein